MIVPLAAGSAVDNAARILAQKMGQNMGQAIVIENQPGAAGLIGADRVAKAAPDGYTLGGFNDSIMTMLPNLQPKMPWDILRDFETVSLVATVEWGLVVPANAPQRSAADLIASARKEPGKINYSSGGNGSPQHIAMALFASQAGVAMTHVPYKGATQAAMGVAGNEVHAAFQGIATVNSLVRAGKVRLIGVTTPQRMPQFPEVPTVAQSGLPGFEFNSWFARDGAGRHAQADPADAACGNRQGPGRSGDAREADRAGADAARHFARRAGPGHARPARPLRPADQAGRHHGRLTSAETARALAMPDAREKLSTPGCRSGAV